MVYITCCVLCFVTACAAVQLDCLPHAITGKDVICQANCGTGKTTSFVLAALNLLEPCDVDVSVVVLTYTRELSTSVGDRFKLLSKYMPWAKTAVLYGGALALVFLHSLLLTRSLAPGVPIKSLLDIIRMERPNIVVGTPGTLKRLSSAPDGLDLSKVKLFVIEECQSVLEAAGACASRAAARK